MMYIGFGNLPGERSFFGSDREQCKDPHLFLAIWAKSHNTHNESDGLDLNALYCKPSYHYQAHEVTVDRTNGSILKAEPVGERTNFTQGDEVIDILMFEGTVGQAATVLGVYPKYFSSEAPLSSVRFEDWDLDRPT